MGMKVNIWSDQVKLLCFCVEGLVGLFVVQPVADWLGRHEPLLSCLPQYTTGKLCLLCI
jgi:hypothetical protein